MNPKVRMLERALKEGDSFTLERTVGELVREASAGDIRTEDIGRALAQLQLHRSFALMIPIADAALRFDSSRHQVRTQYCQALIELGAFRAAETELKWSLEQELDSKQRSEALGLLGRLHKQRFVQGRDQHGLDQAVSLYRAGWETGFDPEWHGVNLLALQSLGHRLNRGDIDESDFRAIAERVLEVAIENGGSWSIAAEAEARLALEDLDGAADAISRLANSDPAGFHTQALRRQLTEIWGLHDADPLVLRLDDRIAGVGQVVLPGSADDSGGDAIPVERFERIFGTAQALRYQNLVDGLSVAQSVGKVTDRGGRGIGTAFLVAGEVFHEALGSELILATNAHVISAEFNGAIAVAEAEVRFEVTRDRNTEPLVCEKLSEIWSSPYHQCDVTLLRFETGTPHLRIEIEPAGGPPALVDGTYVTVVGHPRGGDLSLSLRGNDLIEYDPDKKKMHYRAPTEPGSSGSPVFDQSWKLIGVHHAGHQRMPRLAGDGFHAANEAVTLDHIRTEYAKALQGPTGDR